MLILFNFVLSLLVFTTAIWMLQPAINNYKKGNRFDLGWSVVLTILSLGDMLLTIIKFAFPS